MRRNVSLAFIGNYNKHEMKESALRTLHSLHYLIQNDHMERIFTSNSVCTIHLTVTPTPKKHKVAAEHYGVGTLLWPRLGPEGVGWVNLSSWLKLCALERSGKFSTVNFVLSSSPSRSYTAVCTEADEEGANADVVVCSSSCTRRIFLESAGNTSSEHKRMTIIILDMNPIMVDLSNLRCARYRQRKLASSVWIDSSRLLF